MKQTLQNTDVLNKTVILRVDYNVPIKNGVILDEMRLLILTVRTKPAHQSKTSKLRL